MDFFYDIDYGNTCAPKFLLSTACYRQLESPVITSISKHNQ